MEMGTHYIMETIPFLKKGFLLCQEVEEEDVRVFDFIGEVANFLREEDHSVLDCLLYFIDMYPFLYLCGYSSIASQNLYENDTETKTLGQYKVYAQIPLTQHILHTIHELNKLFSRIGDTGILVKIGDRRIQLTAVDYFYLLVSCLYHDVAKSPMIIGSMGYEQQEYRKSDHAFFSGQYLISIKRDLEEHGVEIPENVFSKVYVPVVSHHQRPTSAHAILLRYIDHRAREYESQKFGSVFAPLSSEEVDTDFGWEIPEDLILLLKEGLVIGGLPRKRKQQILYVRFPPAIYVASYHVQHLLDHLARSTGKVIPVLQAKEHSFSITRYVIKKFRKMGYVQDPKFQDDYLCGWWYRITFRDGKTFFFFGFPITPQEPLPPDGNVVDVRPLTKEEMEVYREKGMLKHSLTIGKQTSHRI